MQLFYLDRVVNFNKRDVSRCFPVFVGWNTTNVKKREQDEIRHGGFGTGKVEDQQDVRKQKVNEERPITAQVCPFI